MPKSQLNFYLKKFQDKIFVLKIGGEIVKSSSILKSILQDIKQLIDAQIKIILVHGGGVQADELAQQLNHIPQKINGRRITTQTDLEIAKMLYGGSLNLEILSIMKQVGLKGIRVSGLDGDLLNVIKRPIKYIDYGLVGDIEKVNPQILFDLLEKSYVPIISPLAVNNEGEILNINADTIAEAIATNIKAEKLILFTSTDGVYDEKGQLISYLNLDEAQALIDQKIVTAGMSVKIHNCIKAIEQGVKRVHIINGLASQSLLKELLTKAGVGTMILSNQEKNIYDQE